MVKIQGFGNDKGSSQGLVWTKSLRHEAPPKDDYF